MKQTIKQLEIEANQLKALNKDAERLLISIVSYINSIKINLEAFEEVNKSE